MDIQLNISSSRDDFKKKKKNEKSALAKAHSFVKDPTPDSKTITKHKIDKFKKQNIDKHTNKKAQEYNNYEEADSHQILEEDNNLQLNTVSYTPKKFYAKTKFTGNQQHFGGRDTQDTDLRYSHNKNNSFDGKPPETFLKSNKVSVASLFKNNPEVPTIGQRAVLPLSEKLFSGELFSDLDIHSHQLSNLEQNLKLNELTTVQQRATPVILQGRDTLVRSQTGSGKTLAYALPIIEALQEIRPKVNRADGIRVLVIVPTRELATQTYELFVKLVKPFIWIVCGVLSGGQKRKAEKAHLRKGIVVLVATPGRLRDHLVHTRSLQFENVRCLVLDEADRLLDMGYEKDVSAVVKAIEDHQKAALYKPLEIVKTLLGKHNKPNKSQNANSESDKHNLTGIFKSSHRQTILLSATLTKAVEKLAGLTMVEPVFVDALEGREPVIADSLTSSTINEVKPIIKNENITVSPKNISLKKEKKITAEKKELSKSKLSKIKTAEYGNHENATKSHDNAETMMPPFKTKEEIKSIDSSSDDEESDKDKSFNNNSKSEKKLGIVLWNGGNHRELLDLPGVSTNNKKESSAPVISLGKAEDNSDSDSDYEFFRAQKKSADIENQYLTVKSEREDKEMEEDEKKQTENSFRNAIKQAIDDQDLVIPDSVDQTFVVIPMKLRLVTLAAMIIEECIKKKKNGKILVFMATQELVDFHSKLYETILTSPVADSEEDSELVIPVHLKFFQLHGSMEHPMRMKIFKQFRDAKSGVLICTDVAARGLDLPYVDTVIQYTIPSSVSDYVHRVGRTGRAGRSGCAILILLPEEVPLLTILADRKVRIRQEDGELMLRTLSRRVSTQAGNQPRFCSQTDRERAARLHSMFEDLVSSDDVWGKAASKAFASWCRQYCTYPRSIRTMVGKLHLGHACRALAIQDAPKDAAAKAKVAVEGEQDKKLSGRLHFDEPDSATIKTKSNKPLRKTLINFPLPKRREFSEFDSGLEPISKRKKIMS